MNIAIVDDDRAMRSQMEALVKAYMDENNQPFALFAFESSEAAVACEEIFDIAFLDVEMEGMSGLACAKHILERNENALILIITAHPQYLDEAMEISVYRYLSKPIDPQRFRNGLCAAVNRYYQIVQPVVFTNEDGCYRISSTDILYLYIDKRNVTLVTRMGELPTRKNMEWWKNTLPANLFSQVHKSFMVNLRYVVAYDKTSITLQNRSGKYTVFCSRRYYTQFKNDFYAYLKGTNVWSGGGYINDCYCFFLLLSDGDYCLFLVFRKCRQPKKGKQLSQLSRARCLCRCVCRKLYGLFFQYTVSQPCRFCVGLAVYFFFLLRNQKESSGLFLFDADSFYDRFGIDCGVFLYGLSA